MARSASAGDRRLAARPWRRCSAPRWPGARLAGRRAAAARPRGSVRAAAPPAWRCGARWTSASTGRSPRAGRPSPSPGRRPPGRRGPPPPRGRRSPLGLARGAASPSGAVAPAAAAPRRRARRSPSSSRRRLPDPGARMTDTSGARFGRALDLNPAFRLLRRASRLRRGERQDLDALEADVDVGPQHGADRLAGAAPARRRRCPWAGARRRRARSMTRRPSGSSTRCRSGVTCGGHATAPEPRGPDAGAPTGIP